MKANTIHKFDLAIMAQMEDKNPFSKMLDREGAAIMKRIEKIGTQRRLRYIKPKSSKEMEFLNRKEVMAVKDRDYHDFWQALMCMTRAVGTSLDIVKSRSRVRQLVEIRHCIFWISYWYSDQTLTQIGTFFGKDHATVLHGVRKVSDFISCSRPDAKTLKMLDVMLTDMHNEGLIYSKSYYTTREYAAKISNSKTR